MAFAARMAESGFHSFYVRDPQTGGHIPLRVVRTNEGTPHLRAVVDREWTNHLLDLPDCVVPPSRRLPIP